MAWALFLLIAAAVWLAFEIWQQHWCWAAPAALMLVLAALHLHSKWRNPACRSTSAGRKPTDE